MAPEPFTIKVDCLLPQRIGALLRIGVVVAPRLEGKLSLPAND